MIVEAGRSEAIFSFVYDHAGVNQPRGGTMFMHSLARGTDYTLPDVSEETRGIRAIPV